MSLSILGLSRILPICVNEQFQSRFWSYFVSTGTFVSCLDGRIWWVAANWASMNNEDLDSVPLYNEEEVVANMLERAIAAPLPVGFEREIIVADDGSTDDSVLEVEAVIERYPNVIRLLKGTHNRGKGAALRRAIAEARGDFLHHPGRDSIQSQ